MLGECVDTCEPHVATDDLHAFMPQGTKPLLFVLGSLGFHDRGFPSGPPNEQSCGGPAYMPFRRGGLTAPSTKFNDQLRVRSSKCLSLLQRLYTKMRLRALVTVRLVFEGIGI